MSGLVGIAILVAILFALARISAWGSSLVRTRYGDKVADGIAAVSLLVVLPVVVVLLSIFL